MRCVVLLSGGMDSAVAFVQAVQRYGAGEVLALYCNYGSKHGPRERQHAMYLAFHYGAEFVEQNISHLFVTATSSLLNGREGSLVGADTVVPDRNRHLLETAFAVAQERGADTVVFSPHKGDAAVYPDCRPAFVGQMWRQAERLGIYLHTPWLWMTKAQVVETGKRLGVNWDWTWSCYCPTRLQEPCGECGACIERAKALEAGE